VLVTAEDRQRLDPYLPFGLSAPASASAITRAQGAVKRMLLDQQLHPGQKVPIDDVASRLEVSRTPVREALRLMEGEGLVRALPNRGFAVRVISVAETAHLFDTRLCIEPFTAVAAYERRDDAFVSDITAIQETYKRILKGAMNRRLGMVADKAFHLRISQQAGNPVLVDFQRKLFDTIIFTRALEGFSLDRSDAAIVEHEQIVAAMRGNRADRVRVAALNNVTRGRDAIIAFLQQQAAIRTTL